MDEDALKTVDPDSAVIFVINHRSNMDYVLVTYMASSSSALSYAVGEWARVWLLQSLIRSMGAYFVRRDSRDPLYRKVLARYVHMAVAGGLAQAVFPEGGLTRDGKLQPPKLGLIGYMVAGFDAQGPRDAVFVPVGINYDRVLEDRLQLGSLAIKEGGRARHRAYRPAHGGQRGPQMGRDRRVVEAHQRELLGHFNISLSRRMQGAGGHFIVAAKNGGRARSDLEQPLSRRAARFEGVITLGDELGNASQSVPCQCIVKSPLPFLRRPEAIRSGNQSDVPMAQANQVFHRLCDGNAIVRLDQMGAFVQLGGPHANIAAAHFPAQ